MSGFRKFRTTLHRRRRTIEATELGYLKAGTAPAVRYGEVVAAPPHPVGRSGHDPETTPLEFSPSREAVEIGPAPIAWFRARKPQIDH